MTDIKHTPGPWLIQDWNGTYEIHDEYGVTIAEVVCYKHDNLQTEPNAHLIAAAPELLEALIALRAAVKEVLIPTANEALKEANATMKVWLPESYQWGEAVVKTDAAIAKATGQEVAR